jgi:hypothetical protein
MTHIPAVGRGGSSLARHLIPFVLMGLLAGGCARARAADVPVGPPLAIPPPPERVLAPIEEEPLVTAPGRTDAPTVSAPEIPPSQRNQPPPPRPAAEQTRQEPPPPAAAAAPAANPAPAELTRQVRQQASAEEAALRKTVEGLLDVADSNLNRVLTSANKQRIDEIRILQEEARKALTERNYKFAELQANKAVQLSQALVR